MKRYLVFLPLVTLTMAVSSRPVSAQATGEITGTVFDPGGAVIPDAKITAHLMGGGVTRSTLTTPAGTYSLPSLPIGDYKITTEALGFKTATYDASLAVNQKREVNFTLPLAAALTEVSVSASPPLLTTSDATLGSLVTGQQVTTLPLNGRDVTGLILLQPGTNRDRNGPGTHFVSGWTVSNGNRGMATGSYMDDVDTSDNEMGGTQLANFNLDAVAEFKLLQNNYAAEYGRGAGMIFLLATKSGSNEVHGTLYEFLRNQVFDTRNFFSAKVPPLQRHEFGGTVGGPIRKDRSFFFFQYAGFRQRSGSPFQIPVPTAQERQGIVDIAGADGNPDQLIVPMVSDAKTVLEKYPLPNDPEGSYGPRTYRSGLKTRFDQNQWSARIDHRFSDKDSIFGRYTYSNNELPTFSRALAAIDPAWSLSRLWKIINVGVTETHVFSPHAMNLLKLSWGRSGQTLDPSPVIGLPQSEFADGLLNTWGPDRFGYGIVLDSGLLNESIRWVTGRHTVNFGIEYRASSTSEYGPAFGGDNGAYVFKPGTALPVAIPSASGNNDLSPGSLSPNSLVSLMVGAPSSYSRTSSFPGFGPPGGWAPFTTRRWNLNGWIQDDFKATPKLTFNLGFRYEYNSVPYEVAGRLAMIVNDPNFEGGRLYRKLVLNPKPLWYPDYNGWGPRFGLAYKLNQQTVFRGGYGIFTNLPPMQTAEEAGFGFPFTAFGTTLNPQFSLTLQPVSGIPVLTDLQGNPLPTDGDTKLIPPNTPVDMTIPAAFFGGTVDASLTSMDHHNGYTMAGNVTLERSLPGDTLLQASYVTNNVVALYATQWPTAYTGAEPQYTPYTNATPGLGQFRLTDNHAHSTYHALQLSARKISTSHGLQFQSAYTWGKQIDNASTVFNGPRQDSAVLQNDPTCWRCEKSVGSSDITHRFTFNLIYDIPLSSWLRTPERLTHGWKLGGIMIAQSGFPFTITVPYGTKPFGTDTRYGFPTTRPDLVREPTRYTGPNPQYFTDDVIQDGKTLGQVFFATPGVLTNAIQDRPGNLGRNTFRSPSAWNVDLALLKDTRIKESVTLQFRCELFNAFNWHHFGIPGARLKSGGFGKIGSTVFPERQIQFALKLIF